MNIPIGYRLLAKGEIIQKGDYCYHDRDDEFVGHVICGLKDLISPHSYWEKCLGLVDCVVGDVTIHDWIVIRKCIFGEFDFLRGLK